MQQFNIQRFSITSGGSTWETTFQNSSQFEGCGQPGISEEILLDGSYQHTWWIKANGLKLRNVDTQTAEGTIDVQLDFTLLTQPDKNDLKIGMTIDLPTTDLPLSDGADFSCILEFE